VEDRDRRACDGPVQPGPCGGDELLRTAERCEGLRRRRLHAGRPCRLPRRREDPGQPHHPPRDTMTVRRFAALLIAAGVVGLGTVYTWSVGDDAAATPPL